MALDHGDELGLVKEGPCQRQHPLGKGRREQAGLSLARQVGADLAHVRPEAQGEQLVGLVEDHRLDALEAHAAAAEVIEDPARGADDDVGALLQTFELGGVADAAVDRQAAHTPVPARRRGSRWRSGWRAPGWGPVPGPGEPPAPGRSRRRWGCRRRRSCRCRSGPGPSRPPRFASAGRPAPAPASVRSSRGRRCLRGCRREDRRRVIGRCRTMRRGA